MEANNQAVPIILDLMLDEEKAHRFYAEGGNYFFRVGYVPTAQYCRAESADELKHSMILQDFLNDSSVPFNIPSVVVTPVFKDYRDFVEKKNTLELALYTKYCGVLEQVEEYDKGAYVLLLKMIDIQFKAMAEAKTHLDTLNQYNNDRTGWKMFEREMFEG